MRVTRRGSKILTDEAEAGVEVIFCHSLFSSKLLRKNKHSSREAAAALSRERNPANKIKSFLPADSYLHFKGWKINYETEAKSSAVPFENIKK